MHVVTPLIGRTRGGAVSVGRIRGFGVQKRMLCDASSGPRPRRAGLHDAIGVLLVLLRERMRSHTRTMAAYRRAAHLKQMHGLTASILTTSKTDGA